MENESNLRNIIPCSGRYHETMATDRTISYMNDILPCSDRCHKTMTNDGACFLLEGYIYQHALTVFNEMIHKGFIVTLEYLYHH